MEDELQQSVLLSEDADPEANSSDEPTTIHAIQRALSSAASDSREDGLDDESAMEDIEMTSDRDASGDEVNGEEVDEEGYYQGEEEEEEEEDAEGEDDYEIMSGLPQNHNNHLSDDDAETGDEDAEGEEEVGDDDVASTTVRLRPEDAEERDEESEVSTIASAADEDESDEEENWEDARDTAEDEDEEESETGPSNICMFCKEDEEHDPSEDFEAYLTCKKCGENCECSIWHT
jgi:histone acetyltransferase SAS3